ncbi:MAG: hypothetical protein GC201_15160 [Alphaproteobacteria bacterium]|nr:hypothetical protein [Alphaproteobacteria bacterium]
MGAAEHRIGRVVFDIDVPDEAALDRFGAMVRARFDAVVAPALEAALDRLERPGEVIRLGRVELDLGALDTPAPDPADLARRIAGELAAALAGPSAAPDDAGASDEAAELAAFLETGELPWAEPGKALAVLIEAVAAMDAVPFGRLVSRLRTVLIRRRAAERLVRQLPAPLVARLFHALLPDALAAPLAAAFGPPVARRAMVAPPVAAALVPALAEAIHRLAAGSPTDFGEIAALYTALDGRAPPAAPPQPEPEPAAYARRNPDRPEQGDAAEAPQGKDADDASFPAAADARSVYAAGAVLLHPFVAPYFDQLGLLAAPGIFRDEAARTRAVLLLHHLATGAEDAPEPETVLFKLLCGMALTEPVPRAVEPTDRERSESADLLTSVIAHWKRLGRTSPDGLREGFLKRPGRLERRGGQWTLTVEARGIDVLLDDLPWTLSRVRTPFMGALLTVDWR